MSEPPSVAPLLRLSGREWGELRGLGLTGWDDRLAPKLDLIDWDRLCVTVSGDGLEALRGSVPLRERVRYVYARYSRDQLAVTGAMPALRFLGVWPSVDGVLDARPLARSSGLRYLSLSDARLSHAEALGELREVCHLDLSYCSSLRDVSWVARLPSLVTLDITGTRVRDLSALAGHASLTGIDANLSRVRTLPRGRVPSLRALRALSTPLADDEIATFRAANPDCVAAFHWEEALLSTIGESTRIVVRPAGAWLPNGPKEILFEETDPARVREIVGRIRVHESLSVGGHGCGGGPVLEFYSGAARLTDVSVDHGMLLRWPGWPGIPDLTADSADFLTRWLADHSIPGPLAEREEARPHESLDEVMLAAFLRAMPAEIRLQAGEGASMHEAFAAVEAAVPDPVARAHHYLGMWGRENGEDLLGAVNLVRHGLMRIADEDLRRAVEVLPQQPDVLKGAARWLLVRGAWELVGADAVRPLLPVAGPLALSERPPYGRRETLVALRRIGGDAARRMLKGVLNEPLERGALTPSLSGFGADAQDDPGDDGHGDDGLWDDDAGGFGFGYDARPPPVLPPEKPPWLTDPFRAFMRPFEVAPDQVGAALMLAAMADVDSLPRIREMRRSASGWSADRLDEAIGLLETLPAGDR